MMKGGFSGVVVAKETKGKVETNQNVPIQIQITIAITTPVTDLTQQLSKKVPL
jgi:hypothetical protein